MECKLAQFLVNFKTLEGMATLMRVFSDLRSGEGENVSIISHQNGAASSVQGELWKFVSSITETNQQSKMITQFPNK